SSSARCAPSLMPPPPPLSPLFPYTTLFRSRHLARQRLRRRVGERPRRRREHHALVDDLAQPEVGDRQPQGVGRQHEDVLGFEVRSEEHTSELQSRENLVCRLLLEKKNRRST